MKQKRIRQEEELWQRPRTTITPSCASFDLLTGRGESLTGSFTLSAEDGREIEAELSSDHPRILLSEDHVRGEVVTVVFGVDVQGLPVGFVVDGSLTAATPCGEIRIPIRVRVSPSEMTEGGDPVRSVRDLADLYARDPARAFAFFTDPHFPEILTGNEARCQTLSSALRTTPPTRFALEEFLVAAGAKEPVMIRADETDIKLWNITDSEKRTVLLRKNTGGVFHIRVRTRGDFLVVQKTRLTDEDFNGSVCELPFIVDADRLGGARRKGEIVLSHERGEIVISVTASAGGEMRVDMNTVHRRHVAALERILLDYELDGCDASVFARRSLEVIAGMKEAGELSAELLLYEIWVRFTAGEKVRATRMLSQVDASQIRDLGSEMRAAYLYLSYQLLPAGWDMASVTDALRSYRQMKSNSYLILHLLMEVDGEIARSPERQMVLLEDLFANGSRSPFLYARAIRILRRRDACLRRINRFMRQVLLFAVRTGRMTEAMAFRAACLAENERRFTPVMYRILTGAYEVSPTDENLSAIVKLLMQHAPRRQAYFKWYALAIERELPLTGLYTCYVETVPDSWQRMLPLAVRRYFTLSNTLSDDRKAFVYANVIRNREADPDTLKDYEELLPAFAESSMRAGRMNADYAVIYQHTLRDIPDEEMGERIADALLTNRIYTDDPRMVRVAVRHASLKEEEIETLDHGSAYIRLASDARRIVFIDAEGRRFASGVTYTTQPMMDRPDLLAAVQRMGIGNAALLLKLIAEGGELDKVSPGNVDVFLAAADNTALTDAFRQEARAALLSWYRDHAPGEVLDQYLRTLDLEAFAAGRRVMLIEMLRERGFYKEALTVAEKFGAEGVREDTLSAIVREGIRAKGFGLPELADSLPALAQGLFTRGRRDPVILQYLSSYGAMPLRAMRSLRAALLETGGDTALIDMRILRRMLLIRESIPEAGDILSARAGSDADGGLLFNASELLAGEYISGGDVLPSSARRLMEERADEGLALSPAMELALLKCYASEEKLSPETYHRAEKLLEDCMKNNLVLGFFRDLPETMTRPWQLSDRVFVEIQAEEGDTVVLRYSLSHNDRQASILTEVMPHTYAGIFARSFVLFYDEVLTYEITVNHEGRETTTKKRQIRAGAQGVMGRSRFALLNGILEARAQADEAALAERIGAYMRAETIVNQLFSLEDEE